MNTRMIFVSWAGFLLFCGSVAHAIEPPAKLFATDRPESGWVQFCAAGYSEPVCGVVYRLKDPVTNGMALGGVDTGCLDLETNGTFGYSTIFNSIVPRGGAPLRTPLLALSVGMFPRGEVGIGVLLVSLDLFRQQVLKLKGKMQHVIYAFRKGIMRDRKSRL